MTKKNTMILILSIGLLICSIISGYYVSNNLVLEQEKNRLISELIKEKENNQYIINTNNYLVDSITNILSFNKENVKRFLKFYDIKHPNIVLKQAKLETNNFTSKIFIDNNNLFGMKEAKTRATTSIGTNMGHATYNSYIDSIKDYKLWQMSRYNESANGSNYLGFLIDIGYATDEDYITKLEN